MTRSLIVDPANVRAKSAIKASGKASSTTTAAPPTSASAKSRPSSARPPS